MTQFENKQKEAEIKRINEAGIEEFFGSKVSTTDVKESVNFVNAIAKENKEHICSLLSVMLQYSSHNPSRYAVAWRVFRLLWEDEKARLYLRAWLEHDPNDLMALKEYSLYFMKNKEFPDAIEFLKRLIELDKNDTDARLMLWHCFHGQNDLDEAEVCYLQHAESSWKTTSSADLALIYSEKWEIEKAKKYVQGFINDNPKDPYWYYVLWNILINNKEYVLAIYNLNIGAKLDPKNYHIITSLWLAFYQIKDYAKAVECFEKSYWINSNDPKLLFLLCKYFIYTMKL